jgi:hypothetical protein
MAGTASPTLNTATMRDIFDERMISSFLSESGISFDRLMRKVRAGHRRDFSEASQAALSCTGVVVSSGRFITAARARLREFTVLARWHE